MLNHSHLIWMSCSLVLGCAATAPPKNASTSSTANTSMAQVAPVAATTTSTSAPLKYKPCEPLTTVDPEKDLVGYWNSHAPDMDYLMALWETRNTDLLKRRANDQSCIIMEQVVAAYYLYNLSKVREDLDHLINIYPEDFNVLRWLDLDSANLKEKCKDKGEACVPAPDYVIFESALAGEPHSVSIIAQHYSGSSSGGPSDIKTGRFGILLTEQPVLMIESIIRLGLQARLLDYLRLQIEEATGGGTSDGNAAWLKKEITKFSGLKMQTQSGMELKHDIIKLHQSYQ